MKTEPSATTGLETYGMSKCHFCARLGALAVVMAASAVLDGCAGPPRYAGQSAGPTADAGAAGARTDPMPRPAATSAPAVLRAAMCKQRLMRLPPSVGLIASIMQP